MSEVEVAISKIAERLSGLLCCNENHKMTSSNCYPLCDSNNPSYGILCPEMVESDIIALRQTLEYEINQMLGTTSETAENWVILVKDWLCNSSTDTSTSQDNEEKYNHTSLQKLHNYQKRRREFQTSVEPPPRAYHLSSASAFYRDVHESLFTRSFDDASHSNKSFDYEENNLCYDSDPGVCTSGYHIKIKKISSNSLKTQKPKSIDECSSSDSSDCHDRYSCDKDDDSSFATFCSSLECDELSIKSNLSYNPAYSYDDDTSTVFQKLINENLTLVYHPLPSDKNKNTSPVCVTAWIEMGSCLKKQLIQPKFMWREAYYNCNNTNKQQYQNPKKRYASHYTYQSPSSIELLSIVRVLKPETINRNQHPFPKLSNSFTLHDSNNSIYLFEAPTPEACDRIVYGLKVVIARLASKIIIGDDNVFNEFFTSCKSIT